MESIKYSISISKEKLGVGTDLENWYYGMTISKVFGGGFKIQHEKSFTLPSTAVNHLEILIGKIERIGREDILERIKHTNSYTLSDYWLQDFGITVANHYNITTGTTYTVTNTATNNII